MAKTTQIMKLTFGGEKYTVIQRNDTRIKPLWLYEHTWERNQYGYYTERKRIVDKYDTMPEVLSFLSRNPEWN